MRARTPEETPGDMVPLSRLTLQRKRTHKKRSRRIKAAASSSKDN
ncbi:MAG TPA: hypothetical protein VGP85_08200 [Pyrinomonadaceae bacterium]|nr:hypothetical protein [Pyrinomonadaceae bacterium]